MGTLVTIQAPTRGNAEDALDRAFRWFQEVEARCTRFDPQSELRQLTARVGVEVEPSAMIFEALRFALTVAEQTGGAFDPTVDHGVSDISYRDVAIDSERRTVTVRRPLTLDLGAVAKGLAVDMAARELAPLRDFAIDAGGGLYLGGSNEHGEPWRVGIFTAAQAAAGRTAYEKTCGRCHTLTLMGRQGNPDERPAVGSLSEADQKFIQNSGGRVPPLAGKVFSAGVRRPRRSLWRVFRRPGLRSMRPGSPTMRTLCG